MGQAHRSIINTHCWWSAFDRRAVLLGSHVVYLLSILIKHRSYTDAVVHVCRIQLTCRVNCRSTRILQLSYLPTRLGLRLSPRLEKNWLHKIIIIKFI